MFYGPNRTICSVLEEMRKLNETRNYTPLLGLIEEAQAMANRMEAKLYDIKDYDRMMDDMRDVKRTLKKLKKEQGELESKS